MKLKGSELATVIRSVVREEISRVLPGMLRECLSEAYVRRIVREQSVRPKKLSEVLVDDLPDEPTDESPRPPKNVDRGIYNQEYDDEEKDEPINEAVRPLFDESKNPLSFLYDGVRPISSRQMEAPSAGTNVPLEKLGVDIKKLRKLSESVVRKAPAQVDSSAEMKRIELRRQMLDVPAFPDKPIEPEGDDWRK
jgi:hypothetical protein